MKKPAFDPSWSPGGTRGGISSGSSSIGAGSGDIAGIPNGDGVSSDGWKERRPGI